MPAIDPKLDGAEREAFIATARAHVRAQTPFRHQGRSERGVDCGGLLALSLRGAGRTPADVVGYARTPYKDSLRRVLVDNFGEPIAKETMRQGDVALVRFLGDPGHVGIITEHPQGGFALMHAYAPMKKVVEHRIDERWDGYIVEVFRP